MTRILFATSCAVLVCMTGCDSEPDARPTPMTSTPSSPAVTATQTPVATGSPAPLTDTVCAKMNAATVAKAFRAISAKPALGSGSAASFPPLDSCIFILRSNTESNQPPYTPESVTIGVSVLPATKADLAARRADFDRSPGFFGRSRPVAVGDGGFGSPLIVMALGHGRLVEVRGHPFGSVNSLAQNLATAREAIRHLPGLPPAVRVIPRPECERGTAAATKVLAGPALVRRDSAGNSGDVNCGWANGSGMVTVESSRIGNAAVVISSQRKRKNVQPVAIGAEGIYRPDTSTILFRIGTNKIVAVDHDARAGRATKADLIALAQAVAPLYTR